MRENCRIYLQISGPNSNFRTFQDKFQNFRIFRTTPRPALIITQPKSCSTKSGSDNALAESTWVPEPGYISRRFTCPQTATHPSTNRARCRVTLLIDTNALALDQAMYVKCSQDQRNIAADSRVFTLTVGKVRHTQQSIHTDCMTCTNYSTTTQLYNLEIIPKITTWLPKRRQLLNQPEL